MLHKNEKLKNLTSRYFWKNKQKKPLILTEINFYFNQILQVSLSNYME